MNFEKKLIAEVQQHPILYDMDRRDYRDKYKKTKIWNAIARSLNVNVVQCKRRWKGLRDTYKKYKRAKGSRSEDPEDSDPDEPKREWKYFRSLSFLDGVTTNKRLKIEDFKDDTIDIESDDPGELSTNFDENVVENNITKEPEKPSYPKISRNNTAISKKFSDFLDMATTSFQPVEKDSTTLLFQALDAKIKEASLPNNVLNGLETKIMKMVYEEIERYHQNWPQISSVQCNSNPNCF